MKLEKSKSFLQKCMDENQVKKEGFEIVTEAMGLDYEKLKKTSIAYDLMLKTSIQVIDMINNEPLKEIGASYLVGLASVRFLKKFTLNILDMHVKAGLKLIEKTQNEVAENKMIFNVVPTFLADDLMQSVAEKALVAQECIDEIETYIKEIEVNERPEA